jgi:hypothetical protein
MHSYFPHPKDRLIILRLGGKPDLADREAIPHLLESRIREHGRILLMLDVQNSEDSPDHAWAHAILRRQTQDGIERLAIVTEGQAGAWVNELSSALVSAEVKHFGPAEHEEALSWVQTGGTA